MKAPATIFPPAPPTPAPVLPYASRMQKPHYLPQEATPEQRRAIMDRTYAAGRAQGAIIPPDAEAAYDRYVAGELTLPQAVAQAMSVYQWFERGAEASPQDSTHPSA